MTLKSMLLVGVAIVAWFVADTAGASTRPDVRIGTYTVDTTAQTKTDCKPISKRNLGRDDVRGHRLHPELLREFSSGGSTPSDGSSTAGPARATRRN